MRINADINPRRMLAHKLLQHHRMIIKLHVSAGYKAAARYCSENKLPGSKRTIQQICSQHPAYHKQMLQDWVPADGQILSKNHVPKFLQNLSTHPFQKRDFPLSAHSRRLRLQHLTTECWCWTAGKSHDGYGRYRVGEKRYYAHVISFNLFTKTSHHPSKNLVLLHSCDNPCCCNPYHLQQNTQRANVADMEVKGRSKFFGQKSIEEQTADFKALMDQLKD